MRVHHVVAAADDGGGQLGQPRPSPSAGHGQVVDPPGQVLGVPAQIVVAEIDHVLLHTVPGLREQLQQMALRSAHGERRDDVDDSARGRHAAAIRAW